MKGMLLSIVIAETKLLLKMVCFTVYNLSYSLKEKYTKSLGSSPFKWLTFEHLGGAILADIDKSADAMLHVDMICDGFPDMGKLFIKEFEEIELFINKAIPDIIQTDIPLLKQLFEDIKTQENHNQNCDQRLII